MTFIDVRKYRCPTLASLNEALRESLIRDGWTIEYTQEGTSAYLRCSWCGSRPRRACSACRGTGTVRELRL